MKRIIGIILTTLLLTGNCYASAFEIAGKEEVVTAFNKAAAWFIKTTTYKVNVTFCSYQNHTSLIPYDKSEGYYKRNNNYYNSNVLGVQTIQNDKYRMTVDTTNQIVVISNKAEIDQTPLDFRSFSEMFENVKSIKKRKDQNGGMTYKLEFKPGGEFLSYEFSVSEKGLFKSVKYYYGKELKQNEDDEKSIKGKPRVEILFGDYVTNLQFDMATEFSEKKFIREENKKVVLNKQYKEFELKDYRFAVKNK